MTFDTSASDIDDLHIEAQGFWDTKVRSVEELQSLVDNYRRQLRGAHREMERQTAAQRGNIALLVKLRDLLLVTVFVLLINAAYFVSIGFDNHNFWLLAGWSFWTCGVILVTVAKNLDRFPRKVKGKRK